MKRVVIVIVALFSLGGLVVWFSALRVSPIDQIVQSMDQGQNRPFTFYAKVLDQDGAPVAGAMITGQVLRLNENWASIGTSANRDSRYGVTFFTDSQGNAVLNGYGYALYFIRVEHKGYRHLVDKEHNENEDSRLGSLTCYPLFRNGFPDYMPDPQKPAVFILVRNGKHVARVPPSPGGTLAPMRAPDPPVNLLPVWPKKPSIQDIYYDRAYTRPPATQPVTLHWDFSQDNRVSRIQTSGSGADTYVEIIGPGTLYLRPRNEREHVVPFSRIWFMQTRGTVRSLRIYLPPGDVSETNKAYQRLVDDWEIGRQRGNFDQNAAKRLGGRETPFWQSGNRDRPQPRVADIVRTFDAHKPFQPVLIFEVMD